MDLEEWVEIVDLRFDSMPFEEELESSEGIERNGLLRGLNRLKNEGSLKTVNKKCEKVMQKYLSKHFGRIRTTAGERETLRQQGGERIQNYLQLSLRFKFNASDETRGENVAEVLCYILMRTEKPDEHLVKIINRVFECFYNISKPNRSTSIDPLRNCHRLCGFILGTDDTVFTIFYQKLQNRPAALEELLYRHPLLVHSSLMLPRLTTHLPFENFHRSILNARDENGRTIMFLISSDALSKNYVDHARELYELLSIIDVNGQTAFNANRYWIEQLLMKVYRPRDRDLFLQLVNQDENQCGVKLENLSWLVDQVRHNRYVLRNKPTVLIIYTTKRRPGAEEEANTILNAFNSLTYSVELERNKRKDEILELIKQTANRLEEQTNLPPSAFIVVLMSHGSVGIIEDSEGKPVSLTSIELAMCQKNILTNNPKILITQCCQIREDGRQLLNGPKHHARYAKEQFFDAGPSSASRAPFVPRSSHFCAIMSSVAGRASERGVFIPKLAEQIENCVNNEDLIDLAQWVSQEMESEGNEQRPIIYSTLKAKFCPGNWPPRKVREPKISEYLHLLSSFRSLSTF